MILLKEQFIALLFSLLCFMISLITGLASGTDLLTVCVRTAVLAIIAYAVGLIFGLVIKSLCLETLVSLPQKKETEEKTEKKATRIEEEKS